MNNVSGSVKANFLPRKKHKRRLKSVFDGKRSVFSVKVFVISLSIFAIIGGIHFYSQVNQLLTHDPAQEMVDDFIRDWCRERTARMDWRRILEPCPENMDWNARKESWGRNMRTSSRKSYVINTDIKPEGQYSKLFLQSVTDSGQKKQFGGDSWRVFINGPTSFTATVIDHMDGTYEALFLIMEAGKYNITVVLDYTLCDGLRDPPYDWFVIGNKHGRGQSYHVLGYLDDFLVSPLGKGTMKKNFPPTLQINVPESNLNFLGHVSKDCCCKYKCNFLWDGFGRWKDGIWLPLIPWPGNYTYNASVLEQASKKPKGQLGFYGDSVTSRFFGQFRATICLRVFAKCQSFYNWVYLATNDQEANNAYDGLELNLRNVVKTVEDAIEIMQQTENGMLIINVGLHFALTTTFHNYKILINNVIDILKSAEEDKRNASGSIVAHKVKLFWKSTTALWKEHGHVINSSSFRFLTYPRVQLFNAYANSVMCKAGIEIIDVFPITASFLNGSLDIYHYNDQVVFKSLIEGLKKYAVYFRYQQFIAKEQNLNVGV